MHWNRTKYPTPNVAAGHGDGLAVLALFLDNDGEENPVVHEEFAKLLPFIDKVQFKGEKTLVNEAIDPSAFLPSKSQPKKIWTYEGSLTTPPLLECVIWIIFQEPIKIHPNQVKNYRHFNIFKYYYTAQWIIILNLACSFTK